MDQLASRLQCLRQPFYQRKYFIRYNPRRELTYIRSLSLHILGMYFAGIINYRDAHRYSLVSMRTTIGQTFGPIHGQQTLHST